MNSLKRKHSLKARAKFSFDGLREAWRRERSFRDLAVSVGIALGLLALAGAKPIEWAVMIAVLATALGFEAMNAAVEALADRLHPDLHREIGAVKDMASGAVFLVNCAAFGLLLAILARHWL